jgi:hypothetical protein
MEIKNIILFILVVILIIMFINYVRKDVSKLTNLTSAKATQEISASDLSKSGTTTSNFTYSIWFYIEDWNYRYGEPKVLFGRMITGSGKKEPCPSVTLGALQNNIDVSLTVYPGAEVQPNKDTNTDSYLVHNCSILNVPIQRWANLLISVYGRTLDIYLDGKLVRTCILPGVAKIDPNAPLYVTPNGGFSGWTTKFQYWDNSVDPQKAWDIYRSGYGGSMLGNLFGNYSVKVAVMEGNTEKSSVTI